MQYPQYQSMAIKVKDYRYISMLTQEVIILQKYLRIDIRYATYKNKFTR